MTEPLPVLIENSLQIAWDFLDRSGGIADPQQAAEILLQSIKTQILKGESRTLMLSNRAIAAFEQHQHDVARGSCWLAPRAGSRSLRSVPVVRLFLDHGRCVAELNLLSQLRPLLVCRLIFSAYAHDAVV
jgi:hypothetical protein